MAVPGYRVAVADGYFTGEPEAREAVAHIAKALDVTRTVSIPRCCDRTCGGIPHHNVGRRCRCISSGSGRAPTISIPILRDRLIAGAMLPAAWIDRAQKFRRIFREKFLQLFQDVDAIIAPTTPMRAPLIGQKVASVAAIDMPLRPNIGIYTQPISFIGLPVVAVPVWIGEYELPIGVQIIAAPWREDIALRLARRLEKAGAASAPVARGFADFE